MSTPIRTDHNAGFSHQALSTAASDSTRQGTALMLTRPMKYWAVSSLLATSTEATLVLRGSASTASDAPMGQIMSVTASTDGETNWSTAPFPAIQVRLDVDAVSSSGGIDAWIAAAA